MAEEDDKKSATSDSTEVDESKTQDETVETKTAESTETAEAGQGDDQNKDWWSPDNKRFTQFKGDTLQEYLANLESAYGHSYEEVKRIKAEKFSEIAKTEESDKEEKSEDQTTKQPPSLTDAWVNQEIKRRHVEQYNSFAEKHPEVNTDDELFEKLDKETGRYMDYVHKTEGRLVELSEALDWAWHRIAPEDSKEEKVASAVKNAGSSSKSKSVSKDPAKPLFTDKQIEAAKRIDPSLRGKSRTEIEEILSKYK